MGESWRLSATQLARAIAAGEIKAERAVAACLDRIERIDPQINAFAAVDREGALAAARAVDKARRKGASLGPLAGVPFHVKDLVNTAGLETAFGSDTMAGNVPDKDVAAVARLRRAGAILVGKTTTPAFGHLALTRSRRHGLTRNPWHTERSPGGSSGGAAAAVAAGLGPLALNTDGAGSARIPAACCGVLGLKPTLGRVPNEQVSEQFSSFVNLGINARTAADVAAMLSVLNGPDPLDPWSIGRRPAAFAVAGDPVACLGGLRILYVARTTNRLVDAGVLDLMQAALDRLRAAGAEVAVLTEDFDWAARAAFVTMRGYQRARLGRLLQTDRDKLDDSLIAALEEAAAFDLLEAQQAPAQRAELFRRVQGLFGRCDLIVTPTVSAPPPAADHPFDAPLVIDGEEVGPLRQQWYGYTGPFNLTGHPAISVPMGFTPDGLPAGLHAVAPWFQESRLIDLAAACERLAPWADRWPAVAA
jgi:aspartyl-tRNA(Asn)/glutamyl-tRNA(Gln) amidotransferase subunit A